MTIPSLCLIFGCVSGGGAGTVAAATTRAVPFYPEQVRLDGVLETEMHFGPPGFGETPKTDPQFRIIVLHLDVPITATPSKSAPHDEINTRPIYNVSRIQLHFVTADAARLNRIAVRAIGKHVVVKGTLSTHVAPMDFTEVTMDATQIQQQIMK